MRKAPPCIERHTEAEHRLAQHKSLEAHLRGDAEHGVSLTEQRKRGRIFGNELCPAKAGRLGKVALFLPGQNVGMRFDENSAFGKAFPCFLQHAGKAVFIRKAKRNGAVPEGLVNDQHSRPRAIAQNTRAGQRRVVVFAQTMAFYIFQSPGGRFQKFRSLPARGLKKILKVRRAGGVVVDAAFIHHQRQRISPLASQPQRT